MTEFRKYSIFKLQSSFSGFAVLFISLLLITTAENSTAQTWHTVRWVNDGDTIVLNSGQRVRYIGINAPEIDHEDQKAQPHGYAARFFHKNLVMSQKIRLEFDDERYDQYGRMLAYIFLQDGSFLNARLLRAGLAFYLYRAPNVRYDKILLKSQLDAMESKNGLWRNWKEKNATLIIGNINSRRFHNPSCSYAKKIKSKNKVVFSSKWDAFRAGYAPSKKCIVEFWSYEAAGVKPQ